MVSFFFFFCDFEIDIGLGIVVLVVRMNSTDFFTIDQCKEDVLWRNLSSSTIASKKLMLYHLGLGLVLGRSVISFPPPAPTASAATLASKAVDAVIKPGSRSCCIKVIAV